MRICLIAEGSYPYITGGVSSWVNQLMTSMPEHEFQVVSISPDHSRENQYAYKLPTNLIRVFDLFLDDMARQTGKWNQSIPMTSYETEMLEQMLLCAGVNWPVFFQSFAMSIKLNQNAMDIVLSDLFYQCVRRAYMTKYYHVPFNQVYWTMRSMFTTVFSLMFYKYPQADVYHAVSAGYAGLIGAYAAQVNHGAFLLTEHGIYTREREEEIIKADWVKGYFKNMWIEFFYLLSDCAYACADQVVTLFNYNKNVEIELGCPPEKIKVIHNGIDIERFAQTARAVELRQSPERINVGAVIRVVPIKDIKTMLQAFSIVSRKLENVYFYIMGSTDEDPEYYDECVQYMNMLKLERTEFTGRVNIQDKLKEMDLLVLTSISEGQPLAILEGLACKLPFVTTNVGDCGDLIKGRYDDFGPAGFVAPVMDYANLADGIIDLCSDHEKRRRYGVNGFNRVKEKYTFDSFISGYRDLYKTLGR
jgi:polysaccharide biosynthesis protein PelF